jgi:hypothetical protein
MTEHEIFAAIVAELRSDRRWERRIRRLIATRRLTTAAVRVLVFTGTTASIWT